MKQRKYGNDDDDDDEQEKKKIVDQRQSKMALEKETTQKVATRLSKYCDLMCQHIHTHTFRMCIEGIRYLNHNGPKMRRKLNLSRSWSVCVWFFYSRRNNAHRITIAAIRSSIDDDIDDDGNDDADATATSTTTTPMSMYKRGHITVHWKERIFRSRTTMHVISVQTKFNGKWTIKRSAPMTRKWIVRKLLVFVFGKCLNRMGIFKCCRQELIKLSIFH